MPHLKCVACRMRLESARATDDLVGELCPGCGSPLEPVSELAEIVGFRSFKQRDAAGEDTPPGTHERIAGRIDDAFARRAAVLAQAIDAERWDDDGGSFGPEAAAQALALPRPGGPPWPETNS